MRQIAKGDHPGGLDQQIIEHDGRRYRVQPIGEYLREAPHRPVTRSELSEVLQLYAWNQLVGRPRFAFMRGIAAVLRALRVTDKPSKWCFKSSIKHRVK